MKRVEFAENQVIFEQGDRGNLCYQVVSGAVDIRLTTRDAQGHKQTRILQMLNYGEVFGEMSVIAGAPRSAAAIATEPTVCVAYTADEFIDMIESDPKEALDYIRILIKRLRSTPDLVAKGAMRG